MPQRRNNISTGGEFGLFHVAISFNAAMWRNKRRSSSFVCGLSRVGPIERMGHRRIVVSDECFEFVFQVWYRYETSSSQNFSLNDAEDDFDLVQPRAMFGKIDEADAMAEVREKQAACGL